MGKHTLGDLQLAIMRVLWENGEGSVMDVYKTLLPERGLAPTTIATMLTKMEKKGVLEHHTEGRRYIYKPLVSEGDVRRSMVSELRDRLFAGDTSALVSHLIAEHEVDSDELDRLRAIIDEKEMDRS